jgi:hypothetical protein
MSNEENINPGSIVFLDNVEFPHLDQGESKYLVVITCDQPLLFLKINKSSTQSEFGVKRREFQFKLKKETYGFLDYDSYLDCGTVWYGIIEKQEMLDQIKDDPTRIKGELIPDHKNEVIRLSQKSRSISTWHMGIIREKFSR